MKKGDRKISSEFGDIIKLYRTRQGLSLREVSELSNVSESYIFRLESQEKRMPSYKVMESLCKALKIDLADLLDVINEADSKSTLLKPIDFIIMTNDFTLNGKKATSKKKEEIVELIEFIFDSNSNINSETKSTFEDIYRLLRLAVDIKND
ncbi:MAG: helix-turn-helix transcriptional regulator [Gudongella sp.]|nr:helix-turn-helix transcriptional regulator [Gudongella sp.]